MTQAAALDCGTLTPDDVAFMRRFEACEVSEDEWTHLAHLRVAWIAFCEDAPDAALDRIRRGILRHNTVVLNRRHKYHETVTVAFARLVAARMSGGETWAGFQERIADLVSAESPVLLQHYTQAVLLSDRARAAFVEPDLKPLPDFP